MIIMLLMKDITHNIK